MAGSGLKTPELVAGARVEREEIALGISGEYKIAGGGQHGGQENKFVGHAPDAPSGNWIPCVEVAVSRAIRRQFYGEVTVHEEAALVRLVVVRRNVRAEFVCGRVDKTGPRRVGHRVPAFSAGRAGAERPGFTQLGFVAAAESA